MFSRYRWSEVREEQVTPLLFRRVVYGQNQNVARFLLKKGCHISTHQHVSEQLTQVLKGKLRLVIASETVIVSEGEILVIPPNVGHEAFADEDVEVQDSFSPRRDDWLRNEIDYMKK